MTTLHARERQALRWSVAGSYFEVCNCQAVCPCRRTGGRLGGRSTYGECDFALSWLVTTGSYAGLDLSGRTVVMAGFYQDRHAYTPWQVILYIDHEATAEQHAALASIFLGRAGGTTLRNFADAIGDVHIVRSAEIRLDHRANDWLIDIPGYVRAAAREPASVDASVSCGIPGHDHLGTELIGDEFEVHDSPLQWSVSGRCGFVTNFAYESDT